jgi:hypothetical protein
VAAPDPSGDASRRAAVSARASRAAGLLCPSASADAEEGVVIGIVRGTADAPRVAYLEAPVPVTPEILARTAPAPPNQVLRIAARCAEGACGHYDGTDCTLARRIVARLDPVVDRPPPCAIRPVCRWWRQEGKAACARCPEVATQSRGASEAFVEAARVPDRR